MLSEIDEYTLNEINPDKFGYYPIHRYAFNGDLDNLQLCKQNINILDRKGNTPLILAISYNHTNAAFYLLTNGANIHIKGYNKLTALHIAIINNNSIIIQYLLDNYNIDLKNKIYSIWLTLKYKKFNLIKYFLF